MTDDEVVAFLHEQRTVICATSGRDGWPHLMPLWYVTRLTGPGHTIELWAWTFAKSQKTKNMERDARATLQVESGTEYHQLRGIMLKTEVVVHSDLTVVLALGLEIAKRYTDATQPSSDAAQAAVEAQARKRVALQFVERSRATWDHAKLTAAVEPADSATATR